MKRSSIKAPETTTRKAIELKAAEEALEEALEEAETPKEVVEESEEEAMPAWKANFGEDEEEEAAPRKKRPQSAANSNNSKESSDSSGSEGKPLDNRALAGLMGKDDGANLKGLKDDTKKALSGMKTATEVSSDVLNKLFLKRSPQIKRCASRHNLTGKVVVKFAVRIGSYEQYPGHCHTHTTDFRWNSMNENCEWLKF